MTQPNALRLADWIEADMSSVSGDTYFNWRDREIIAELRRLHHNNQVLMDALWKACGDDEGVVNDTIASEGELK
jgi:hypothetical protein